MKFDDPSGDDNDSMLPAVIGCMIFWAVLIYLLIYSPLTQ